jgi:predicted nucleotidyltransferase
MNTSMTSTLKRHKIIDDIPTLTQRERNAITEFAALLRRQFGDIVREIILFGSKPRGESRLYSDIDILIVLTTLTWEIKCKISELASQENIKYDVLISTIRYDEKLWNDPAVSASPFGSAVRAEGVPL